MRAGLLDRRIIIQSQSVSQSDSGENVVTWSDVATVWAQKVEVRGSERFTAQQLLGQGVKIFRFRWSTDVSGITTKHRIISDDGRICDITDVREIGTREGIEVDVTLRTDIA